MADTVMPPPHATRSTMVRTRSMTRRLAAAEPPMLPFAPPPLPLPAAVPLAPAPPASSTAVIVARRLVRASVAAVTVYTATALALNALGLAEYDADRHVVALGCSAARAAASSWCSPSVRVEIPAQWLPLAPRGRTSAVDATPAPALLRRVASPAHTPESASDDAQAGALVRQEDGVQDALRPPAPATPPPPLRPHDADPADGDALRKPRPVAPTPNADRASESLPNTHARASGPDDHNLASPAPRHAVASDPTLAHGPGPALPPPGPPLVARDPLPHMHPDPDPATLIRIPILDRTDDLPRATPASAPIRPASPLSPRPVRPVAPRVHDDAPSRVPPPVVEALIADLDPVVDTIHSAVVDLHAPIRAYTPAAAMSPDLHRFAMPLAPTMRRTLDLRESKAPWTANVAACAILVLFVVLVARIIAARRRAMQSTQFAARATAEASVHETLVAHEAAPATADVPASESMSPTTSRPRATSLSSSISFVPSSSNTTLRAISRASSATPTRRRSASPPPPVRTHVLVDGRPTHRLVAAKHDSAFDDDVEPTSTTTCDWVPVEDRMHASMHSDAASTSSLNGSWALCRSLGDVTLAPTVPADCAGDLPTASFVAQEMDDGVEIGALAAAALVEAAASVCEPDPAVSDSDEEHGGARSDDDDDGPRWAGQQRSMATRWEAFYCGEMEIWQVLYEPVQDAAGEGQVWDGPGYSVVRVKDVEGKAYLVHLYPPALADAARHWCDFVDHVLTAAQTKGSDSVCTTTASTGGDGGRSSDLLPPVHGHGELLPDMPPGRHDRTPSASTTASLPSSIASSSRSGSSSKPLRLVPTDKFFPLRNGAFARITPVYAQSPAMMRDITRRPRCSGTSSTFHGWDAAVMLNLLRDVVPVLAQVLAYVLDRITSAAGSAGNTGGGTARRAILRAWVADADVAIVGGVGDALNGKFAVLSVLPRALTSPGGAPLPLGHAVALFVLDLVAPPLEAPLPPATNPRALSAAIREVCRHATLARAVADTATAWTPLHSSSVAVAGGEEDGGDEIAALHRAVKTLRHVRARIKREMAASAVVAPEGGVMRARRSRRESVATSVASISEVDGERDEAVGSEAHVAPAKSKSVVFASTGTPEPSRDHGTASPLVPPFVSSAASWTSSSDGGVLSEVVAMEAAVAADINECGVVARKPVPV
ncbi:hypothetical protein GGF31_000306 [Allomyces arbusculus]|nr:hypothetical protein GGF31_000306 [Allomyces arbusculus]